MFCHLVRDQDPRKGWGPGGASAAGFAQPGRHRLKAAFVAHVVHHLSNPFVSFKYFETRAKREKNIDENRWKYDKCKR